MSSGKKRRLMTYGRRRQLYGWGFISLWFAGTVMFFLIPLIKSLWYSFNTVTIEPGRIKTEWAGTGKFVYAI